MQLAKTSPNGGMSLPSKGVDAVCPCCGGEVISKIGDVIIPHWAHKSLIDCDTWYEPRTTWHIEWQKEFSPDMRHCEKIYAGHRADVVTDAGVVVELQHSNISEGEILEREACYGRDMVWIFDCRDAIQRIDYDKETQLFTWNRYYRRVIFSKTRVLLDIYDGDDEILNMWYFKQEGSNIEFRAHSIPRQSILDGCHGRPLPKSLYWSHRSVFGDRVLWPTSAQKPHSAKGL